MTPNDKVAQKPKNVIANTNLEDSKIRNNLTVSMRRKHINQRKIGIILKDFLGILAPVPCPNMGPIN